MEKINIPPQEALYPAPVVLVSSIDKETGRPNIITIAWCGVVSSEPPTLSISIRPSRYSHKIIKSTGDFVVNIPSSDILDKVDLCGIRSGREIDKFKECFFTSVPSSKVASPFIRECPVNIECKLKDVIRLGAHDMFIGEIVCVHVDKEILKDKNRIDVKKINPLLLCQGKYWDIGKEVGAYGFSSRR